MFMPTWSWQWMTLLSVCLFFTNHKKWFIFCDSHDGQQCSVLISILTKIQSLSNLSGNVPPFLHIVHMHPQTQQHSYPQTKPIVPKLLPTIWEQICQKCHYNFRVIFPCALCYNAPSLKSLLELISMNQIRKSEVWRILGNKWWTWKDPYLMFEYKSNFNWCSIKNLWRNVDWLII